VSLRSKFSQVSTAVLPVPDGERPLRAQLLGITLLGGTLWLAAWVVTALVDLDAALPSRRTPLLAAAGTLAVLAVAVAGLLAARRPRDLPPAVVAITSGLVAGLATAALHGTRWSFNAIYSDAGFRTQAVTRFADSPKLADYGYRGLPSYYPPALPWVEGRLADLLGVPGWAAMKPVTLVLAALVPVLAYVLWRRVLSEPLAAVVVAATTLATVDLVKPDEWLVLALLVPWWLELVRGIRAPGRRALPFWGHGLVLGGLLLVHSFFFLPMFLASLVGLAVDLLRRAPLPLRPVRGLLVGAVGAVVSAPYWLPMVVVHLQGAVGDDLQRRWSRPGFESPPLPLPTDVVGVLGLVGVLWLVLRARTVPLAASLGVALGTTYVFFVGGQLVQRFGIAVLPEKSADLLAALLVVSGVLGLSELLGLLRGHPRRIGVLLAATVAAAAVAVPVALGHAQHWLVGRPVLAAQQMRYPDGSYPAGGLPDPTTTRHPWGVSPLGTDPSTDQVLDAWKQLTGRPLGAGTVLVAARADLLATNPVHSFISWKSIYSHPDGRFLQRQALLERVAACSTPRCAYRLLRDNPFDRVDGLVLTESGGGLQLTLTDDVFPDGWVFHPIVFPPALFERPWFTRRTVGNVAVVSLRR
jgi:galactan 5-O-arabinofuranosyltransferase